MAESQQGEKTEEPTQQRREDFRKRGQVAQTKELSSVFILLTSALMLWALARFFGSQVFDLFDKSLTDHLASASKAEGSLAALQFVGEKFVLLVLPCFAVLWVMSAISSLVQVGFLNNEEALELKFERLNPVEGFFRIFSLKNLVEGVKSILKLIVVALVTYFILKGEINAIPKLMDSSVLDIMIYCGRVTLHLFVALGIVLLVISGMDYFFQWWELEKEMKMTKQEVKEELKSREGDPLNRSRMRRLQRELANRRMMEDVKTADVIVTNPTHLAVALKYDPTKAPAPRVVAKGAGVVAEKIRELAKELRIPIVENKPLARTMFKSLKIGQVIPRELYAAVAEVLAFVFRLKRRRKGV